MGSGMNSTGIAGEGRVGRIARRHAGFFLILAVYALFLSIHAKQAWVGIDGVSGALWSTVGRNIEHNGYAKTRLGQPGNDVLPSDPREFQYYQNHPPLLAWSTALVFRLAGEGELQARLLPILFSLGSLALLHHLVRGWYGGKTALFAAFVFAVLPMSAYYGRHVNFEPPTIFFILAVVALYQRWLAKTTGGRLAVLAGVYAFAMISDWPAYFLAGLLPVHHFIVRRRLGVSWIFPLISAFVLAAHLLHAYWLDPRALERAFFFLRLWMGLHLQEAASGLSSDMLNYSASHFAWVIGNRFMLLFTIPALVAAAVGLVPLVREIRAADERRGNALLVVALLLVAVINNALFYKSLYVHLFWSHYFVMPISILAGLTAAWIESGERGRNRPEILSLRNPGITVLALVIAAASLSNLKELHAMQARLLPDRNHESADLVPRLAAFVRNGTDRGDLVVTNWACGPGLEAFVYYAGRHVQCGAMKGAEGGRKEQDAPQPGRRTVLLAWSGAPDSGLSADSVTESAKRVTIGNHGFSLSPAPGGAKSIRASLGGR